MDSPGLNIFDPSSCSPIPVPASLRQRLVTPLRRGEGWLDFGPRHGTAQGPVAVLHHSRDGGEARDTGIRLGRPMLPQAVRAAHDGSYLIYDLNQNDLARERWVQRNSRTIWRLDRHGQARPLQVPGGPWVGPEGGTIEFLPARPGLLIQTNRFAPDGAPGQAGLYLLRPGQPAQRLERGLVEEAALSPNGCRLAYGFRLRLDTGVPEGGPRLVVIDLCPPHARSAP